jgi:hypothetical protein
VNEAHLEQLEQDVEVARDRVIRDLTRLRAPNAFTQFKDELWAEARQSKDEMVDNISKSARETGQRILGDIKKRAIANPAASLAIASGVTWHFIRSPPITSLLVGLGVVSLIRTLPTNKPNSGFGSNLRSQAGTLASSARKLGHERGSEAAEMIHDDITSRADTATELAGQASEGVGKIGDQAGGTAAELAKGTSAVVNRMKHVMQNRSRGIEVRDRFLLGGAALSVTAAIGIAFLRPPEDDRRH